MDLDPVSQLAADCTRMGLVVPLFNEERRWNEDYWRAIAAEPNINLLFVDDGSTDRTGELIGEFSAGLPRAGSLLLKRNSGKSEAVRTGLVHFLQHPEINCVGFIDADGAFDVEDVTNLGQVFERQALLGPFEAVWSSRVALAGRKISRSTRRHYMGRIISTILSSGLGVIPYDTQSGLKLFRPTRTLAAALAQPFRTRWLFEIEIMIRWKDVSGETMRIIEEPLWSWRDVPESKVHGREAFRAAREVAAVLREARSRGYRE